MWTTPAVLLGASELVFAGNTIGSRRTEARRRLAAFAPAALLVATFAISCLALVVGVP
jgi:hypothetical protein